MGVFYARFLQNPMKAAAGFLSSGLPLSTWKFALFDGHQ
jgi:hypothetical protein